MIDTLGDEDTEGRGRYKSQRKGRTSWLDSRGYIVVGNRLLVKTQERYIEKSTQVYSNQVR